MMGWMGLEVIRRGEDELCGLVHVTPYSSPTTARLLSTWDCVCEDHGLADCKPATFQDPNEDDGSNTISLAEHQVEPVGRTHPLCTNIPSKPRPRNLVSPGSLHGGVQ